jgi:hypothetical protein
VHDPLSTSVSLKAKKGSNGSSVKSLLFAGDRSPQCLSLRAEKRPEFHAGQIRLDPQENDGPRRHFGNPADEYFDRIVCAISCLAASARSRSTTRIQYL